MADLIFEIGVEELPALAIEPATAFLKDDVEARLKNARLSFKQCVTYGTPRRLVVLVDDLSSKQEDLVEEVLGPNVKFAYDDKGNLSPAGLGFVKSKGLDASALYRKMTDKGEVIAAKKLESGRTTKDLLKEILLASMRAIPFKKTMRWEASGDVFARPIRWLVCLYDQELVQFKFADVETGNLSRGHRFMSPEAFAVTSREQYLDEMKKRFVMLSSEDRERHFIEAAEDKLSKISASFVNDKDLMATVRNLFEYPFAILGSFEEDYLKIPADILICEMKAHQKCFAVYDKSGHLLPYFICSAGVKPFDEEVFAKGNARVLRARFEDGAFYFGKDREKTLRQHGEDLKSLIFERELGTVFDKSVRIEKQAVKLAERFDFDARDVLLIKSVAPILKADLVTGVVGQFPELEGIMGQIYAKLDKESDAASQLIAMHYLPRFAEDVLPLNPVGGLLSIADKLDTLVGIIAIGKKPAGNKDPFALRRAAIGIVRVLVNCGFGIELDELIEIALSTYQQKFSRPSSEIVAEVKDFILQRARVILIDDLRKDSKDYAVNFADSTLVVANNNIVDGFARAHTLYAMRTKNKTEFDSLVQTIKRAGNIVKKAESAGEKFTLELQHVQYLQNPAEISLLRAIEHAKGLVEKEVKSDLKDAELRSMYAEMFSEIALLKPKLDAFFDNVMVMADDVHTRNARLALLSEIKRVADRIADFTHL